MATVQQAPAALEESFRGQLIAPGDPGYDEARALYNAMIDKRPALIARCADVADVIAAVNYARDSGMELAVSGGGPQRRLVSEAWTTAWSSTSRR